MAEGDSNQMRLDDDPDVVRAKLSTLPSGSWSVFETFAADGSLAIGITPSPLPPGTAIIVYDGLTKSDAERAATGYHRWRLRRTSG